MEDFIHLHVHTQYSILDGQSKIPHLVDKAVKDGMKGMAVTDHGVMFGIKELTDYCGKVNKGRKKEGLEPFKPIIGCEMYVAHRRKEDRDKNKGDMSGYHLIVWRRITMVTKTSSNWSAIHGWTDIICAHVRIVPIWRNIMRI